MSMEDDENSHDDTNDDLEVNTANDDAKPNVLQLMKCSWNRIYGTDRVRVIKKALEDSGPLTDTIDLDGIKAKMSSYTTIDDYLADIDDFIAKCKVRFKDNRPVLRAIKSLSENYHRDMDSIRKCCECFSAWTKDHHTYFTRACSKPHLLLYVKTLGNPYWPAKLMSLDGETVNVEFFGDHTQADVSPDECLLYSERMPGRNPKQEKFVEAKKELFVHIRNLKKKFGTFKPAGYRCALNPREYERQLRTMIPSAFDGNVNLANGYEYRDEWIEVQRDGDFNDSISEVIGSSMGIDAPDSDDGDGDGNGDDKGDGGDTSSGQNRSESENVGHRLKERQRARNQTEKHHVENDQVKRRRMEESSEAKVDQTEEHQANGCQTNGNEEGKDKTTDSMSSQVPQSVSDSHDDANTSSSFSSAENETPRRARKTFPSSVPKFGEPKEPSETHRTTNRRINEFKLERDQLLSQNRAYEEELAKLREQLKKNDHQIVCATCRKCLKEPYFCSTECHLEFN